MEKTSRLRVFAVVVVLFSLVATAVMVPAGIARAVGDLRPALAPLAGEAVRGELNGWGTWAMTGSLGGTFIHTTGQITAASDSTSEFKFFKDSDQWYGKDAPNTVTFGTIFTGVSIGGGGRA